MNVLFLWYPSFEKDMQYKKHNSVISILSMLFLLHVSQCKWQLANWAVLIYMYMYYDVFFFEVSYLWLITIQNGICLFI